MFEKLLLFIVIYCKGCPLFKGVKKKAASKYHIAFRELTTQIRLLALLFTGEGDVSNICQTLVHDDRVTC
jgi:hypothetical protein